MNIQALEQTAIRGSPPAPATEPTGGGRPQPPERVQATERQPEPPSPRPEGEDQTKPGEPEEPTREDVATAVSGLNAFMESIDKDIEFAFHKQTEQLMVEVIDRKTHEVVQTFPPEELLDLAARIEEMVGMFLDERT